MAKLVEILAREWKNWPVDAWLPISQDAEGALFVSCRFTENGETRDLGIEVELSDDLEGDVTRAQWVAERARILAESSKLTEQDKEHIAELTAIACGKRSKEDQALWDRVVVAAMSGLISCDAFHGCLYQQNPENAAIFGADCADAFMAERAKRMKESK